MNTFISIAAVPKCEESDLIEQINSQVKYMKANGKSSEVIIPINILKGKMEEQQKECHKLVDDLFRAYKETL